VEEELERLELRKSAARRKAPKMQHCGFEPLQEILPGERVAISTRGAKEDGNPDIHNLFVVDVVSVEAEGTEEPYIVLSYKDMDRTMEGFYRDRLYELPSRGTNQVYPKNHLVLFQRTLEGGERKHNWLLEVGWLAAPFEYNGQSKIVKVNSFDGGDVLDQDFVFFDVFDAKVHQNDVVFKCIYHGIEFNDSVTYLSDDSDSSE